MCSTTIHTSEFLRAAAISCPQERIHNTTVDYPPLIYFLPLLPLCSWSLGEDVCAFLGLSILFSELWPTKEKKLPWLTLKAAQLYCYKVININTKKTFWQHHHLANFHSHSGKQCDFFGRKFALILASQQLDHRTLIP